MTCFLNDESGATTLDWVVLAAAVCTLCLSSVAILSQGPLSLGETTGTAISQISVASVRIGAD